MTKLTRILFVVPLMAVLGPTTISSLLASGPSTAQASWSNLGNLARGDDVKVLVSHGSAQRGTFQSVTGNAMVVHLREGDQTFERQSVTQVLVKREGHRARHALIGALLGGGIGLGVGAAADRGDKDKWLIGPQFGKGSLYASRRVPRHDDWRFTSRRWMENDLRGSVVYRSSTLG